MKLYFAPGACSFVLHCLLEIAQAQFEPVLVKLHKAEQRSPEFLAINPHGQVPVLVTDGQVLTQISAISTYIAELFPQQEFLPKQSMAKAKVLSMLAWMNNTVHPTFTHFFMPSKFVNDQTVQEAVKQHAVGTYRQQLSEIDQAVGGLSHGNWLSGRQCGPVDVYALTLMRWGGFMGIDAAVEYPALWAHIQRVTQVSGVARTMERERLKLVP